MPTARVNGVDIYYEDTGGSGPALLFSHGMMLDVEMFRPQIEALRGRYRCVAWDQRGFGRTGEVSAAFTFWDLAKDALGLLDVLKVERATLIGLSQGGFLSMRAALLAPKRVNELVLIATRHDSDSPDEIEGLRGLLAEWEANGSANLEGVIASRILGEVDATPWIAKWRKMSKTALRYPGNALAIRDDLTPVMDQLRCRALVIHGEADQAINISRGVDLAARLPQCRGFIRVPGAAHCLTLSHPSLVNDALTDFLAGLS
ncbi:MAG TPA: alpha/beta hydrolase [Bauldia sp.]|nr:alpha/beta hydrolase [Bauldia sp.]